MAAAPAAAAGIPAQHIHATVTEDTTFPIGDLAGCLPYTGTITEHRTAPLAGVVQDGTAHLRFDGPATFDIQPDHPTDAPSYTGAFREHTAFTGTINGDDFPSPGPAQPLCTPPQPATTDPHCGSCSSSTPWSTARPGRTWTG